jgi:hypothetical protein
MLVISHADIGGSYGTGDLSDVALNRIAEQAKASGVKMKTWQDAGNEEWGRVTNPVLHDKSDAIRFGSPTTGSQIINDGQWNDQYDIPGNAAPGAGAEDRTVRYRDGTTTTQRQMTVTGMTNADTEQFIRYDPTRSRPDNITGTVDMQAYRAWLLLNGYDLGNLTVQ